MTGIVQTLYGISRWFLSQQGKHNHPGTLVSIFLFAVAANSHADIEYQGPIPIELFNLSFMPVGDRRIAFYSDIPDEFPDFELPQDYAVVVGMKLDYGATRDSYMLLLETEHNEDDAIHGLVNALTENGWNKFSYPSYGNDSGDENSNIPRPVNPLVSICHDILGSIQLQVFPRGPVNLVRLNNDGGFNTCVEVKSQIATMTRFAVGYDIPNDSGVRQYLPPLEFPEEAKELVYQGSLMINDFDQVESKVEVEIEWTKQELYLYFSPQLRAQGWLLDSEWNGVLFTGGHWVFEPESDSRILASIKLREITASKYELTVKIQRIL